MTYKNVLWTNDGVYISNTKARAAARDCVKHFGQGEKLLFALEVYDKGKQVADHHGLSYGWNQLHNEGTFIYLMARYKEDLPGAKFRVAAVQVGI